jgi:hypothetical protein
VLCAICAWGLAHSGDREPDDVGEEGIAFGEPAESVSAHVPGAPSKRTLALWFALAMFPSMLLLATTNQVCLDVASVPFLWVLPLTLYLLTFIISFDNERWYYRPVVIPAACLSVAWVYHVLDQGAKVPLAQQIAAYFTSFFFCALVCHGELVRRKPDVRHLTSFYLLILWLVLLAMLGTFGTALLDQAVQTRKDLAATRNFYGVLRVTQGEANYEGDMIVPARTLVNGRIQHGFQYGREDLLLVPTTYYSPSSGVGLLLNDRPPGKTRRVGLVGLGIGTLAAYAEPGDHYRFYEINTAVVDLARRYFHYLDRCRGEFDIALGDARLTMEREDPQNYDAIVLDAFSGDAIPIHLLTREAFAIYLRHLAPEGVIAVHISNHHFDLRPVVEAVAEAHHLATLSVETRGDLQGGYASNWVLVARDAKVFGDPRYDDKAEQPQPRRVLWTDDRSSLFEVLSHDQPPAPSKSKPKKKTARS